ncbi:MAG: hypothetical protein ABI600_01235 [Luteolibacter sp.]
MSRFTRLSWLAAILVAVPAPALRASGESIRIGVLQPEPANAKKLTDAGVTVAVLSVLWDRFEPVEGAPDSAYIQKLRTDLDVLRRAGLQVVLDLGIQYPPAWLTKHSDSRYQNQYGEAFVDRKPGMNVANSVFNAKVRDCQAAYMGSLFGVLGKDFSAVRLGGGWFGELNFPPANFQKQNNCYWGFDAIAQGVTSGLPTGMIPCPVPGWKPSTVSTGHVDARSFLNWYLDCLKNYHDWQIATTRRFYTGPLMMMYPSWGIRPGQIEAAVTADLSGTTSPERNGEIQRGFDFARFISGIADPEVGVHCTWLDSNPAWSDEVSGDESRWSPVHYLASLAKRHSPALKTSAENTGGGGPEALRLCAERARTFGIQTIFWAFEPDLFDGQPPELKDLSPAFAK